MSTVFAGVGTVSRAITNRPACRAFAISLFTAEPFGVIRMPLSPREIAFSIAWIWVSVSPSFLPAARVSLTLFFLASDLAAVSIATKYGLLVVLTMRLTPTSSFGPTVVPPPPPAPEEQAVSRPAMAPAAMRDAATALRGREEIRVGIIAAPFCRRASALTTVSGEVLPRQSLVPLHFPWDRGQGRYDIVIKG